MRRFELVEGQSGSFWEVRVNGNALTMNYGRLGTCGRTKRKTFASMRAALEAEAELIRKKSGRGYREVADSGLPALGSAESQSAPLPAIEHRPTDSKVQSEDGFVQSSGSAENTGIRQPSGGFAWDESWRARLPVVRGIHAPPLESPINRLLEMPWFADTPLQLNSRLKEARRNGAWSAKPAGSIPWNTRDAIDKQRPERFLSGAPEPWHELLVQCVIRANYSGFPSPHCTWLVESAIAARSLAFATALLLDAAETIAGQADDWAIEPLYRHLRHALATAADDLHASAAAEAEARRGRSPLVDCIISFLFPENSDWAEEAAEGDFPMDQAWWLEESILSEVTAGRLFITGPTHYGSRIAPLLLQILLRGEALLPVLHLLMLQAPADDELLLDIGFPAFLELMSNLHTPALIPTLMERADLGAVRDALNTLAARWPEAVVQAAVQQTLRLRENRAIMSDPAIAHRVRPHLFDDLTRRCRIMERWTETLVRSFPVAAAGARSWGTPAECAYIEATLSGASSPAG